jgi:hypothetical protein
MAISKDITALCAADMKFAGFDLSGVFHPLPSGTITVFRALPRLQS